MDRHLQTKHPQHRVESKDFFICKEESFKKQCFDGGKEDIDAGRECLIKGLCIYLNEDPVKEYMDMTEANTLRDVEGTTVRIYVARETPSNDYSDVGVILEGVVVLHDLENVALAAAMLFGLMYALNMNYPSKLRYTLEVIQKVIMELDASVLGLSRKAQNLKGKCT
ncbi:hypothetical protein F7725_021460, partial [Dissostichus mawsoni]